MTFAAPATGGENTAVARLFFVHVMKTAGTSLFWAMRNAVGVERILPRPAADPNAYIDSAALLRLKADALRPARLVVGHFPFYCAKHLAVPVEVSTVLREPVARTVSLLKQQRAHHFRPETPLEKVYADSGVFAPLVHNHQVKMFALRAADDECGFLTPLEVDEQRFNSACRNLESLPLFGLSEHLDDYFAALCSRFGWSGELPRLRVSNDDTSISAVLRQRIIDDNAWDIAFYRHAQSVLDARSRQV